MRVVQNNTNNTIHCHNAASERERCTKRDGYGSNQAKTTRHYLHLKLHSYSYPCRLLQTIARSKLGFILQLDWKLTLVVGSFDVQLPGTALSCLENEGDLKKEVAQSQEQRAHVASVCRKITQTPIVTLVGLRTLI